MKQNLQVARFAVVVMVITIANLLAALPTKTAQAAATSYQYPCSPYVVGGYNFGQYVSGTGYHAGQDIACSAGTPVYATAEGTVMYSAQTPSSYRWGNLIMIQHYNPDGSQATSLYGHLSADRRVAAGQTVGKGQLIGFIGPAWSSQNGNWADHLHFQIRPGGYGAAVGSYAPGMNGYVSAAALGQYVNPADYVNARRTTTPPPAAQPSYDYQIESVSVLGGNTAKQGLNYVDFRLRNTGTATWRINGANPIKLGTINPQDRLSSFSVGQIGQGWSSANRIALISDTPPGQVGTFRGLFNNTYVPPGSYVERFAPVVEGVQWLADKGIAATLTVQPARYDSVPYSQGVFASSNPTNVSDRIDPNYLVPGQKFNVKIMVKNTGDLAWQAGGTTPVRIGTSRTLDRGSSFATGGDGSIPLTENWPSYNRPSSLDGRFDPPSNHVVPASSIAPGEIGVFSFTMTAPSQSGTYNEYFQPVVDGVGWLPDYGIYFPLRVLEPGYHYEYAGQQNPGAVAYGDTSPTAKLHLRNSGSASWPIGGNVRLGTDRSQDRISELKGPDWLSGNRITSLDQNLTRPGASEVKPGEIGVFAFSFAGTSPDSTYTEYVRPVVDGAGWMPEDYGIYFPVTIQSPAWRLQVVHQSFDRNISQLHYGDSFSATLAIKNLGWQTWRNDGTTPVRLATNRPPDRGSGFADLSNSEGWLSINRASRIDGRVTGPITSSGVGGVAATDAIKQGEIAYFKVPMRTPVVPPGAYPEYFNLVAEGVTWFPDLGIYFPLQVTGP